MPHEEIQWFNYNVPKEQWTAKCPESLSSASEKDKGIIGSWNEDFKPMGWEDVKHLIGTRPHRTISEREKGSRLTIWQAINRIDKFHRSPSELRRYRQYIYRLEHNYGSVMNFIINERLQWQRLTPSGPPFSDPDDFKVLYNDWPYGIDSRIVHLVVWVKFDLEDDPLTGFLMPEATRLIQDYVRETFCSQMPSSHVCPSLSLTDGIHASN
jgi:hypothetical protein